MDAIQTNQADSELMTLLDRMAKHDEAALKALYDMTSPKLFGLALRVVNKREWAEDVLQEAYMHIWRAAVDYRASLSPPMAWMGLIVRSRALDFLRRRASERMHLTQELDEVFERHHGRRCPQPHEHRTGQRTSLGLAAMYEPTGQQTARSGEFGLSA